MRITDIQDNTVNLNTVPYTDCDISSEYLLQQNDILFARTGATVGKSYLVEKVEDNCIYASYLIKIRYSRHIGARYVKHFFESGFYWEQITSASVGIGQPNVNGSALSNLMIPIPPFKEQERIVAEVENCFSQIDIIEQSKRDLKNTVINAKNKILDLALSGRLTSDTSHYGKNNVVALKDVVQIRNGYAFKSNHYQDDGIRIIRISNVQDGFISDEAPKYYPNNYLEELKDYMLHEGDLLMSLTGNVGRVGFLPQTLLPAALNQRVACIRQISENIDIQYLFYIFKSQSFLAQCVASGKGVAQQNISTEWLKRFEINLPPIEEQRQISQILNQIFKVLDSIVVEL